MQDYLCKVIPERMQLGKLIIKGERKHRERMIIVQGYILEQNPIHVVGGKTGYFRPFYNINPVIPIQKLVMQCVVKTNKCNYRNSPQQHQGRIPVTYR